MGREVERAGENDGAARDKEKIQPCPFQSHVLRDQARETAGKCTSLKLDKV